MKTGVTIVKFTQTGMDSYKDVKETKIFDDSATLLDIKKWIHSKSNNKKILDPSDISLATVDFSDIS